MNAFRGRTCDELIHALNRGGWDKAIGVIVLTETGDKAFCIGGDQSAHGGNYDGRGMIGLPVEELQSLIRDVPKLVMQGFDYSRALIGLQCCGAAQASLDESWSYVGQRHAFGAPIAQYQGVTFPLAEGEGLVAAVRQLCYYTLRLRDEGAPHTAEAAMCKWLGPKTAVDVIHQCLLTHGHSGGSLDLRTSSACAMSRGSRLATGRRRS